MFKLVGSHDQWLRDVCDCYNGMENKKNGSESFNDDLGNVSGGRKCFFFDVRKSSERY
jgi:hypothetical protein